MSILSSKRCSCISLTKNPLSIFRFRFLSWILSPLVLISTSEIFKLGEEPNNLSLTKLDWYNASLLDLVPILIDLIIEKNLINYTNCFFIFPVITGLFNLSY